MSNNKPRLILSDADGVLLWWIEGFNQFMTDEGYDLQPDTERDYSIAKKYGISDDKAHRLVKEFNEGEYIKELKPLADSVHWVKKLANEHGFRFIVITSVSDDPQTYEYRLENLTNLFGDVFDELHCLPMGSNKSTTLREWEDSGLFWIEDLAKNAVDGHNLGLQAILVSDPTNDEFDAVDFPRVSAKRPWEEIYKIVAKEYGLK